MKPDGGGQTKVPIWSPGWHYGNGDIVNVVGRQVANVDEVVVGVRAGEARFPQEIRG